jgi:hypothetical protein
MLAAAPSHLKLVGTDHVPSDVTTNPESRAFWANMSTDD